MSHRAALVQELARYQAQLFRHRWTAIGSLYRDKDDGCTRGRTSFVVGPIVARQFFWGASAEGERQYGPYTNAYSWLIDCLDVCGRATAEKLSSLPDSQDHGLYGVDDETLDELREDLMQAQDNISGLRKLLPLFFSPNATDEPTVLFHDDLHLENILSDGDSAPMLIDWELAAAYPVSWVCQLPNFLQKPMHPPVVHGETTEERALRVGAEEEAISALRTIFLDEMSELKPEWMEHYSSGSVLRHIVRAVLDGFTAGDHDWVEGLIVTAGNHLKSAKRSGITPNLQISLQRCFL